MEIMFIIEGRITLVQVKAAAPALQQRFDLGF
jgi:hypothetical protein